MEIQAVKKHHFILDRARLAHPNTHEIIVPRTTNKKERFIECVAILRNEIPGCIPDFTLQPLAILLCIHYFMHCEGTNTW